VISVTLSRRYARALLALSRRKGEIDRAHEELKGLAEQMGRDPRVRRFFETPNIARTEKLSFLEERLKPRLCLSVFGLLMVLLRREVDPALIGGAVVSLDHQVIDGTLATELWRIRRQLLATRVHGRG